MFFLLFKFRCLSHRKVGNWNFLCLCFMSITGVNKYKVQHIHRALCLCEWMWTHEVKQCFELSTMNIWMKLVCFNSLPIVFYSTFSSYARNNCWKCWLYVFGIWICMCVCILNSVEQYIGTKNGKKWVGMHEKETSIASA